MALMATYVRYCIPLGRSILLFFPECPGGDDKHATNTDAYVVQVTSPFLQNNHKNTVQLLITNKKLYGMIISSLISYLSHLIFACGQEHAPSVQGHSLPHPLR